MRDFEKISFSQFKKDVKNDKSLYEHYKMPARDSIASAGYDFFLIEDLVIQPGQVVKLPTGVKSYFASDEVLFIIVRSSTGFKYNIRLVNQVGVIDSDYYNNPDNEGHIFIKIQNQGDQTITFKAGEAVAQGIFLKYLATDSDHNLSLTRGSDY